MPPKVVFKCNAEGRKDVPLTDYKYVKYSNGALAAMGKCPSCGGDLFQIVKRDAVSKAEYDKLPIHKSKSKKSAKKGSGHRSATPKSPSGSRARSGRRTRR